MQLETAAAPSSQAPRALGTPTDWHSTRSKTSYTTAEKHVKHVRTLYNESSTFTSQQRLGSRGKWWMLGYHCKSHLQYKL